MDQSLATLLVESGVRIAGMWPIHGLTEAIPDAFMEAVEDRFDKLPPEILDLVTDEFDPEDGEHWAEMAGDAHFRNMFGFIVQADCPVFTATSKKSASCSWGHWRSKLIYGETAEEALGAACEWARSQFREAVAAYEDAPASGTEARRAETGNTDSVHDGPVRDSGDAQ